MSVYDFKAKTIDGEEVSLEKFKGKVLLIVNTASKCGFTPQYEGLEKIYKELNSKGFEILGFPCNQFQEQEPGENSEVKKFCQLNFGVSFPLFAKIDVKGKNAHPLFTYLTQSLPFKGFDVNHPIVQKFGGDPSKIFPDYAADNDDVRWNFTKFLIDKSGNPVARFEPTSEPEAIVDEIEKLL